MFTDNLNWNKLFLLSSFITVVTSTLTIGFFYLKKYLIKLLPFKTHIKNYLTILLFIMVYSFVLIIPFHSMENVFSDLLYWYASISLGIIYFLILLTALRDFILFILYLAKKIQFNFFISSTSSNKIKSNREIHRKDFFIKTYHKIILPVTSGFVGYGLYQARKVANRTPVQITLKNLPKDFDGFKITQITDIHVGPTIKREYIEKIVEAVNSTQPDMVAITGDLVDGSVPKLYSHIEPLKNMHSEYGSYFVTGNHEYYSGAKDWIKAIRSLGIQVLLNEHTILRRKKSHLILAGVTDYTAHKILPEHKTDPAKAIQNCDVDGCKILLAHQPRSLYKAVESNYDLQISGHTHGGQLFPFGILVHLVQPFVQGLHYYKKTWIYVNKGTGYWGIPMRLGAPSEIAEIVLRSA